MISFSHNLFHNLIIRDQIRKKFKIERIFVDKTNELTVLVNGVKNTFYKYPFRISYQVTLNDIIKMPDLLALASMKSFALGRRTKWKDYVDLYLILEKFSLADIVKNSKYLYKNEFNEKLLRKQLTYFEDVDYSEKIEYMPGKSKSNKKIAERLT